MLQRPQDGPSRRDDSAAVVPCLLLLTDTESLYPDTRALRRAVGDEAALVPRLCLSAIGLGPRHDASVLYGLVDLCSGGSGGLGSYYHAERTEDAVAAVAEGLGQWLTRATMARDVVLTMYAEVRLKEGAASVSIAQASHAHTAHAANDDEEGGEEEEEGYAVLGDAETVLTADGRRKIRPVPVVRKERPWSSAQFQTVAAGGAEEIAIKNPRLLRLDLGSLTSGGERHVLVKLKLPASTTATATATVTTTTTGMTNEEVASIVLRYQDARTGVLREQTLQLVAVRRSCLQQEEREEGEEQGKRVERAEEGDEDPIVWYERARFRAVQLLERVKAWVEGSGSSDLKNGRAFLKAQLRHIQHRHSQQERDHRDNWAVNDHKGRRRQQEQEQQEQEQQEHNPLGRLISWHSALDAHAVLVNDLQACLAALPKQATDRRAVAILTGVWYAHARRKGGVVRAEAGSIYDGGSAWATTIRQEALRVFTSGGGSGGGGGGGNSDDSGQQPDSSSDTLDGSSVMVAAVAVEADQADNDVLDETNATAISGEAAAGEEQTDAPQHRHRHRRYRGKKGSGTVLVSPPPPQG
jgi:hypothetical protein